MRNLDTAIEGSSKDVLNFALGVFSALQELVEPHINAFKVRLAVTLKEEAKRQVFVRDCENYRITGVCPIKCGKATKFSAHSLSQILVN